MPLSKQMVLVEGWVTVPGTGDEHPEHPIYIPILPPPDSGLHPEHPIYFPVHIWGGGNVPMPSPPIANVPGAPPTVDERPPGTWGGSGEPFPTPPIYLPLPPDQLPDGIWGPTDPRPDVPIYLPIEPPFENLPPIFDLSDEQKEKLLSFLVGNLPPGPSGPDYVAPVGGR